MIELPKWRVGRSVEGMSAILLPIDEAGMIDWDAWAKHLQRTWDSGLTPAVNMDTGYVQLLQPSQRSEVLRRAKEMAEGRRFVAGVFVDDHAGDRLNLSRVAQGMAQVRDSGGLPILFPSHGWGGLTESQWLQHHRQLGEDEGRFLAFELGKMFVPYGRVLSLGGFEELLGNPLCVGSKHSSLDRCSEWQRLASCDRLRPEFRLLTGNDLAIDMVFYGSDYLLGLSTMAPDLFALRDHWWQQQDGRAIALNDWLQYLGAFTFRPPVPAYRHSAAMFLHLRGWASTCEPFPGAPRRPESDREVLEKIWTSLQAFLEDSPEGDGRDEGR